MKHLALVLLCISTLLWGDFRCDRVVARVYLGLHGTEKETLDALAISEIDPGKVEILSSSVYKVRAGNGVEYVVRLGSGYSDVVFEKFASEFTRAAPHVGTPLLRTLDKAETARFLGKLPKETTFAEMPEIASVALFLPVESSTQFFTRIGAESPLLSATLNIAGQNPKVESGLQRKKEDWRQVWLNAEPIQQSEFVREMKKLGGNFESLTEENAMRKIETLAGGGGKDAALLIEHGIKKIPEKIRRQIADHWVLYSVLGISDFHSGNYLIHGDDVIGIDMALRVPGGDFDQGKEKVHLSYQQFPIDWMNDREKDTALMVRWASPETIQYLDTLKPEQIKAIAERSGFTLTPKALAGILARIQDIFLKKVGS